MQWPDRESDARARIHGEVAGKAVAAEMPAP